MVLIFLGPVELFAHLFQSFCVCVGCVWVCVCVCVRVCEEDCALTLVCSSKICTICLCPPAALVALFTAFFFCLHPLLLLLPCGHCFYFPASNLPLCFSLVHLSSSLFGSIWHVLFLFQKEESHSEPH